MAQGSTQLLVGNGAAGCWTAIRQRECQLVIESRQIGHLTHDAERLAAEAPFERRAAGQVEAAVGGLGSLPLSLVTDIRTLAMRFADLMNVSEIRLRLEGITTDACRKIHLDYTDVRLITTYFGPGSEYVPAGKKPSEDNLQQLPCGAVALIKGSLFAEGHEPCFHRSPRIAQTGTKRLVLVIDTAVHQHEERSPACLATAAR